MSRPLFSQSIDALLDASERNWSDAAELGLILQELYHRDSRAAVALRQRLRSRLDELSGDAGDELFGGYNRYISAMSLASIIYKLPLNIQKILHSSLSLIPLDFLQKIGGLSNIDQLDSKFKKALIIMNSHNFEDMYLNLISSVPSKSNFVLNSVYRKPFVLQKDKWPSFKNFENCMMYLDTLTYLPDDILTKVDRSAMGVSLETRVPFLDPKLIEFD